MSLVYWKMQPISGSGVLLRNGPGAAPDSISRPKRWHPGIPGSGPAALFDCNRLGEVAGLVDIASAADGDVVGQQLQGQDLQDRKQQFRGGWDIQDTVH